MTRLTSSILVCSLLVLSPFARSIAADGASSGAPAAGAETRQWLQLQVRGAQSDPQPPRQPGEAASRAYQRYLKSFERPVPESYFANQHGFISK